jgi:rhodanese-related sulfurtransferase
MAVRAYKPQHEGKSLDASMLQCSKPTLFIASPSTDIEGSVNIPAFDWQHGYYTPREEFRDDIEALIGDGGSLCVICADGRLSAGARTVLLESQKFDHVEVVDGGLRAWEEEGIEPGVVVDEDGEDGLVGAGV